MRCRTIILFALFASFRFARGDIFYSNGPVINGMHGGTPVSAISQPNTTFGYNASGLAGHRIADNFQAGHFWRLQGLELLAYQTNATAFSFTSAAFELRWGKDFESSILVYSDSNLAVTSVGGPIGYRVDSLNPTSTSRPLYKLQFDITHISLAPESWYWIIFSINGADGGPVYVPQVMQGNSPAPGNALLSTGGGAFAPLTWGNHTGNTAEVPFQLDGFVPELGTAIAITLGTFLVASRKHRKPMKRYEDTLRTSKK